LAVAPQPFCAARAGNFGVTAALCMIPLVGAIGFSIDYARGLNARAEFQDRADEAALSAARRGPVVTDAAMFEAIKADVLRDTLARNVEVRGSWTAVNEFTVSISGDLPLTLASILPGVGTATPVSAAATARWRDVETVQKPPETTYLDPDAWDYNKIYAYCYDEKTKARSREVAIADNAKTSYKFELPSCGENQALSFRLENLTNALHNKNWKSYAGKRYNYYTDTVREDRKPDRYSSEVAGSLETVLCPSLAVCTADPKNGGIIPTKVPRNPARASEPCAPGKFMYYGWEDRTAAMGGDRDFDDIRIVVECPSYVTVGEENVRLVR
jgi:Flp pilus assembly protein TadG